MGGMLAPDAIVRLALAVVTGAVLGVASAWAAARLSAGASGPGRPAVAALQAGLAAWAFIATPTPWLAVASLLLSSALLILALVDVATLRLPDLLTLPLIPAGIGVALVAGFGVQERLIGAAVGYGGLRLLAATFRRLRGRDGLGLGDAKLLAAAGAWLGWRLLPWTVLLACLLAFAWVGARLLRGGRATAYDPLPFGAPLAAAFWLSWLYGAPAL